MRGLQSDGDDNDDDGVVIHALNSFFLDISMEVLFLSLGLNQMNRNEFHTIE